jgi:hypothetical protein
MEYKDWLDKKINEARKREQDQFFCYQTTGNKRYYREYLHAGHMAKALLVAEQQEAGISIVEESIARFKKGLLLDLRGYLDTLPPEMAVDKLRDLITVELYKIDAGNRGKS